MDGVGHGGQGTTKVVVTRRECDQVAIPSSKGAYWGKVGLGLGLGVQGGWGVCVGVGVLRKWR